MPRTLLTWRKEHGARRAAADTAAAVMLGLYECREDTDEDMLLVRTGLPGAGKAVMACAVIAARQVSTLVLVDRRAWPTSGGRGSASSSA